MAQLRLVNLPGEGGLLAQLTKLVVEGALEGEFTDHLGWESGERADEGRSGNYRDGHRAKTVTTEVGPVEIKGLTHAEISAHLQDSVMRAGQDWQEMAKAPKPVYTAPTEAAAVERFAEFRKE
jgi:transposase-like protein